GSTGRTSARNSSEKRAMLRLKSNPGRNVKALNKVRMNDSRWKSSKGWSKMEYKDKKNGTIIHFNRKLGKKGFRYDDLKFKNRRKTSNTFNGVSKRGIVGKSPHSQFYRASKKGTTKTK